MRRITWLTWTAGLAVALAWGTARADDSDINMLAFQTSDEETSPAWEPEAQQGESEWEPSSEATSERAATETEEAADTAQISYEPEKQGPGLALSVGGGVNDFVGSAIRDATNTGGGWDARVALGTRNLIGVEAGYIGTANGLDTLGVDNNAILLSNGITGLVRLNILPRSTIQPYVAGGAGWRRYEVTNTDFNTSALLDSDDVLEVPAVAGVSYRVGQFIGDLRGAYRFAFEEALLPTADNLTAGEGLDNWDVTLTVGYEFGL